MVCATASTKNPGMVHLEFQRKIGQNDIREGKLIARMFVFLHRKGGKYRLGIAITHDEAYMLRSVLDDAIRDSRRMLNAELVQGRPVDLERCTVETSAKYH
jgi:hypothetical protein